MIPHDRLSRRSFLRSALGAVSASAFVGCDVFSFIDSGGDARLTVSPGTPTGTPALGEIVPLRLGVPRDGILYVPTTYTPDVPMPLFVGLHGAGGTGRFWEGYAERAEEMGFILLAPDARRGTWDEVTEGFGEDVRFLDDALALVFSQCRIAPGRIALGGFSDGAGYALSLGVVNGDLFSHLMAYSPGFYAPGKPRTGKPRIFVSHGKGDVVLSYTETAERIVPKLRDSGYDVRFESFLGNHMVPTDISTAALDWFMDGA